MPALTSVDAVVLVLLLAFAAWAAWQGMLRPLFALAVLAAAFPVALAVGPRLEGAVVKAVSVGDDEAVRIAWAVAFVGTLLAGGLLFTVLRPLVRRLPRPGGALRRVGAAAFGLAYGAAVLGLALYAILAVFPDPARRPWTRALARSRAAAGLSLVAEQILEVAPIPGWLRGATDEAERRIRHPHAALAESEGEAARGRRPRHAAGAEGFDRLG